MLQLFPNPDIRTHDEFLTKAECDALIELSRKTCQPSTIVNRKSGSRDKSQFRESFSSYFGPGDNALIDAVTQKLQDFTKIEKEFYENGQLTYYKEGGFYKAHYDFFDPQYKGNIPHLNIQGQRLLTFIIYLNVPEEGGYTSFPQLGMAVTPETGKLLIFENVYSDRRLHMHSMHAADPVSKGEKFIFTTWVRERKYNDPSNGSKDS